jgi:hypothetical protein
MRILYKKDSKGKILQWEANVIQNVFGVSIVIKAGEFEGKLVTTTRENIKGKNTNKSNETTPYTQAELDVNSLYNKKQREGYKSLHSLKYPFDRELFEAVDLKNFLQTNLKLDTRDLEGNLKPMRCQQYYRSNKGTLDKVSKTYSGWTDPTGKVWEDRKYYFLLNPYVKKTPKDIIIKFPALIQPKINGVRATISLDANGQIQILSKEGLKYDLSHIKDEFEQNKEVFVAGINGNDVDIIFDGELYIHDEKLQVISSAVKAFNINTPRVVFVAFDLAISGETNLNRFKMLKALLSFTTERLNSSIEIIKTHIVQNDGTVQLKTDDYIADGYEGSVLRNPDGYYAFGKRPMDMVKLKRVVDEEFTIVDIVGQDKNPELGLFVCRTKHGKEFKVTPKGNRDFKELILFQKHLYINKLLTCTFYEYTEDGVPFHVIDNIVRDYE